MADRTVRVRLEAAVAGFTASMAQASASTKTFGKQFGKMARDNEAEMRTLGTVAAAGGVAIMAGLGGAAKAAMDFESSFAGVRKTVDASEAEFEALEAGFRGLAREIPISVNELNGIGEAAGQLGIAKENILEFSATMADLGVATNMTAEDAATAFARFANITGMAQTDFDRLGSTVVALGNNLATTESEISEFALRLSGAGSQIGLTEAEILGLGGALSSVGINAEAGGTAISKVMIEMASEVETGGDKLALFADIAGKSASDFATSFRDDPAAALASFIEGLGGVEAAGGSLFGTLEELGIKEARMRDALLRTAGAGTLVADSMNLANTAFEENTALSEEAAQRYGTLESRITLAKNAIVDAGISLGQTLTPALGGAADAVAGVAGGFADLPGPAQAAVAGVGGVVGTVSLASGAFLLAAPRIVATKDALVTLSTSMPRVTGALSGVRSVLMGPWGIALAGATAAVGLFAAEKGRAKARIEEVITTLNEETGALTDNSREWASKKAQELELFDSARQLEISRGDVINALMGEEDALRNVNEAINENLGVVGPAGDAAFKLSGEFSRLHSAVEGGQEAWRENAESVAESEGRYLDLTHALNSGLTPAEASARIELQALAEASEAAVDPVETLAEGVEGAGQVSGTASGQIFTLSDSIAAIVANTGEAITAMELYEEMIARSIDPVYNLHAALNDVDTAQDDYNEAVKEFGENSPEAQDAAFELMRKVHDLEAAVLNGDLSFEEFETQLARWVREGKITSDQADDIRERVKDLRDEAEEYDGSEFNADFTARLDRNQINDIERELSYAARTRTARITANVSVNNGGVPVQFRASGGPVKSGAPYIVGERGPELYVPDRTGTVISAAHTAQIMAPSAAAPAAYGQAPTVGGGPSYNFYTQPSDEGLHKVRVHQARRHATEAAYG